MGSEGPYGKVDSFLGGILPGGTAPNVIEGGMTAADIASGPIPLTAMAGAVGRKLPRRMGDLVGEAQLEEALRRLPGLQKARAAATEASIAAAPEAAEEAAKLAEEAAELWAGLDPNLLKNLEVKEGRLPPGEPIGDLRQGPVEDLDKLQTVGTPGRNTLPMSDPLPDEIRGIYPRYGGGLPSLKPLPRKLRGKPRKPLVDEMGRPDISPETGKQKMSPWGATARGEQFFELPGAKERYVKMKEIGEPLGTTPTEAMSPDPPQRWESDNWNKQGWVGRQRYDPDLGALTSSARREAREAQQRLSDVRFAGEGPTNPRYVGEGLMDPAQATYKEGLTVFSETPDEMERIVSSLMDPNASEVEKLAAGHYLSKRGLNPSEVLVDPQWTPGADENLSLWDQLATEPALTRDEMWEGLRGSSHQGHGEATDLLTWNKDGGMQGAGVEVMPGGRAFEEGLAKLLKDLRKR